MTESQEWEEQAEELLHVIGSTPALEDKKWKAKALEILKSFISHQIQAAETRHHAENCQRRVFYQQGVEEERRRISEAVEKMKENISQNNDDEYIIGKNDAYNAVLSIINK